MKRAEYLPSEIDLASEQNIVGHDKSLDRPQPTRTIDVLYRSFYDFREKPFLLLPDPAFLYISDKHRKALVKLRSAITNRGGITVITGEIGSGKTTLVQHLIKQLENNAKVGLINNIHSKFDNLLEWILLAFNVEYTDTSEVKLYQTFMKFVQELVARQRSAILFVDEAQNMTTQLLEELRLLMNVNIDHVSFQVVLVGQPELRDILKWPSMRQFAQRITVEHHLPPLGEQETGEYIQHRLRVAGGNHELFDTEACSKIHQRSQGVPRLINSLCDTVLEYGAEMEKTSIDGALVSEILDDTVDGKLLALTDDKFFISNMGEGGPLVLPTSGGLAALKKNMRLDVFESGRLRSSYLLNGVSFTIGNGKDNDIHLNDAGVSHHHARIVAVENGYFLKNLGSQNGIDVNRTKVLSHILQHGDVIKIGRYTFRYICQELAGTQNSDAPSSLVDTDAIAVDQDIGSTGEDDSDIDFQGLVPESTASDDDAQSVAKRSQKEAKSTNQAPGEPERNLDDILETLSKWLD